MRVCVDFVLKNDPLVIFDIKSDLIDLFGVQFVLVAPDDIHCSHLRFLVEETTLLVFECDLLLDDRFFDPLCFLFFRP